MENLMDPFESAILPVLPLKDTVVFPSAITPLFVIRPQSIAAMEAALVADKRLFLACQKEIDVENPRRDDIYEIGTVGEILQVLRVPDGSAKILVEGIYTARAVDYLSEEDSLQALLVRQEVKGLDRKSAEAFMHITLGLFDNYCKLSEKVPEDLYLSIKNVTDPLALVHAISNYSGIKTAEKQRILEVGTLEEKFMLLNSNLEKETQLLELETQIVSQVKNQIGRSQREYFLNEQLKAIERELGISPEERNEFDDLRKMIEESGMPKEAKEKADRELGRLTRMPPMSPEATVSRTYIEWLCEIPWKERTPDQINITAAREILDEDHYGLEKVKTRIIEYLAVTKMAGQTKGPLICLVGPPGVGKTSLARSVARCLDRKFVRLALGGVRDEAEIRGHRRTYIGALPGKIVQSLKKAGTMNPVILLDEIDKMSSDFRGDPAAALLEVLDPEQNKTFNDHYLDVDCDLSSVLFITTANSTDGIPVPLQDRLEVIRLAGYTDMEKVQIAKRYLVPKAIKANGLKRDRVRFHQEAIRALIENYTREAGVRNLEREVNAVCRKIVTLFVEQEEKKKKSAPVVVDAKKVRELLGPEKIRDTPRAGKLVVGNAVGLAWTEVGGEVLDVETRIMPGKGELLLTGKLGDVMKESARTALSYVRSIITTLPIDENFHRQSDIHVHLPEGAIPKDGPSAGIALASSLVSALSGVPARQDIALTGEITLHGRVLKVGGIKEKVLAAYRNKIRHVIIPAENIDDLLDIPEDVRKKMTFSKVERLEEVLLILLGKDILKKRTSSTTTRAKLGRLSSGSAAGLS